MTSASLTEIRDAVDRAAAYAGPLGPLPLPVAIDLACDELGIPLDRDRRIVRNALERRLAASGEPAYRKAV